MTAPSTTDEYLAVLPSDQRAALQQLREELQTAAPEAIEAISSGVPAFTYRGKYLVSFSAAKEHVALLVMQGNIIHQLADELAPYDTGKRIIRFAPDKPLPTSLIQRIVDLRTEQIDAHRK